MDRRGLFAGDALIKTAIELGLEDLKKNPWVIEHIFASFIENPALNQKYGMKEIHRAKEFLLNNKIHFYMKQRIDKMEFPCITIAMGNSNEIRDLATLGDASTCVLEYSPDEIQKPIQYILKPSKVVSYDENTGILELEENEENSENYKYLQEGMVAIDPETGNGYVISGQAGTFGIQLSSGLTIDSDKIGIIPKYQVYRARMERIVSSEMYNIGCHAHGDPSTLVFLFAAAKYSILRYREGLFERHGFDLGTISCTDMVINNDFGADNVYSRFIQLSGQAEEYWIKTPYRVWETVDFTDSDDLTAGGIKIVSNLTDGDAENDAWTTIEEDDE